MRLMRRETSHNNRRSAIGVLLGTVVLTLWSLGVCASTTKDDDDFERAFGWEQRAREVNEGALSFLTEAKSRVVHRLSNSLTITRDTLVTGWLDLLQCHETLDAVPDAEIVYRYHKMRDLRVESFQNIERVWIEDDSVQLKNVGHDARLCVRAQVANLYAGDGTQVRVVSGPFHRRFLDGYYPMRIAWELIYPEASLAYEGIAPTAQTGFDVAVQAGHITVDAFFEGVLTIEVQLRRLP